MFNLADVLERAALVPETVNVMLHSPKASDGDLLRLLPGLVRTRRKAMEAYQAFHAKPAERALTKGRHWVATFVKTGPGQRRGHSAMLFAGLYRNRGHKRVHRDEIAADPEIRWLRQTFRAFHELDRDDWEYWTRFDLALDERMSELQGRLTLEVRLTQSYVRLAENLDAPVLALTAESSFDAAPPSWRELVIRAGVVHILPASWAARLEEWRGIYMILDERDGARYVGSAYGEDNLLGRWQEHVAKPGGITAGLSDRDPGNFRFSILELLSPTATPQEVIAVEQTWMTRLDTVRFGLNRPVHNREAP